MYSDHIGLISTVSSFFKKTKRHWPGIRCAFRKNSHFAKPKDRRTPTAKKTARWGLAPTIDAWAAHERFSPELTVASTRVTRQTIK